METKKFEKTKKAKIWGFVLFGFLTTIFCGILCLQNFSYNFNQEKNSHITEIENEKILDEN